VMQRSRGAPVVHATAEARQARPSLSLLHQSPPPQDPGAGER
jgi:hypothetical protein